MPVRAVTVYELSMRGVSARSVSTGATAPLLDTNGPSDNTGSRSSRAASSAAEMRPSRDEALDSITLHAHVSKGTYIRSLARDIARALGTCGHVTMLRRTRAGPFGLDAAISLDRLNEIGKGAALENILLPLEAGLDDIPALTLGPEQARAVREGRVLTGLAFQDGLCWARTGTTPVALMQVTGGDARVVRGFNLTDVAE